MARRGHEGQEEIDSHSDVGLVNIFSQSQYHLKTVEPTAVVSQCFVNTKYLWLKHFADGNGSDRLCVPMQTTISWLYANWVGQPIGGFDKMWQISSQTVSFHNQFTFIARRWLRSWIKEIPVMWFGEPVIIFSQRQGHWDIGIAR